MAKGTWHKCHLPKQFLSCLKMFEVSLVEVGPLGESLTPGGMPFVAGFWLASFEKEHLGRKINKATAIGSSQ